MPIRFHSQIHTDTGTVISSSDDSVVVASLPNGLTVGQLNAWMDRWQDNLIDSQIDELESAAKGTVSPPGSNVLDGEFPFVIRAADSFTRPYLLAHLLRKTRLADRRNQE